MFEVLLNIDNSQKIIIERKAVIVQEFSFYGYKNCIVTTVHM